MASTMLIKTIGIGGALMYAEENLLAQYAPEVHQFVTSSSSIMKHCSIPKGYGFVIAVNLIFGSALVVSLGLKVGASRKKFMEKVRTIL